MASVNLAFSGAYHQNQGKKRFFNNGGQSSGYANSYSMGLGSGYNTRGGFFGGCGTPNGGRFHGGRGNWLTSTGTNNAGNVIYQLCGKIGHVV